MRPSLLRRNRRSRLVVFLLAAPASRVAAGDSGLFAHGNLVAWCIVPFDTKKRGPEERTAMLERLGINEGG